MLKWQKKKRKDLEYYTHLVDKVVAGFERTDFKYEGNSSVDKILSNNITFRQEIISERESNGAVNLIVALF